MKVYDVYCQWGVVTFKAERVERWSTNDKPTKILFFVGDELVGAYGFKYVVTKLDGKEVCLVDNHGDIRHTFLDHEAFTKTGKHYPIDEMLKELE